MSTAQPTPSGRPIYRARVERRYDHAPDVRSLFLRCLDQPLPPFLPGMFISIVMPLADEVRVRPYTIASTPERGEPLEIVFNRVPEGAGTKWLFERNLGDEFDFTGPFGAFTIDRPPSGAVVFIAEGAAIAPIRPMLHRVLANPVHGPIELLYTADRPDHLLYCEELQALAARHSPFRCEMRVSAGKLWDLMREEVKRRWIDADADRARQFYICGIGAGVIEMRDLLRAAGYERRAVHYEKW